MGTANLGATGSVGEALARRLIHRGESVALLGRDAVRLGELSDELGQPNRVVDISSSESVEVSLASAAAELGGLDAVVNCIGSVLLKAAHLTSDAEFRETVEINLFSAFAVVRAGAKLLQERGGSIVLFASSAARRSASPTTRQSLPPRRV